MYTAGDSEAMKPSNSNCACPDISRFLNQPRSRIPESQQPEYVRFPEDEDT